MKRLTARPLKTFLALSLDQTEVVATDAYSIAGVYGFGRGLFERGEIAGSETSYKKLNRLHEGQLVVSRLKAFEGALAVVPKAFDGWFLSPEFPTFRCIEDELDPGYLAHVCRWPDFWSTLASNSKGIGARRERVHVEGLLQIELCVPAIGDQRRVARRLDLISTQAAELDQHRLVFERMRRSLFESRVGRLFAEIDSPAVPIEVLGEVRGGIQKSSARTPGSNPVRYLTVAHVGRDQVSLDDQRFFEVPPEELGRRRLQPGDVLIIEGNGSSEQIGRAALFHGAPEPFVHQNHVIRVRPFVDVVEPDFLNLFLNSPAGRTAVQAQARTSSGLQSLSVGRIKRLFSTNRGSWGLMVGRA